MSEKEILGHLRTGRWCVLTEVLKGSLCFVQNTLWEETSCEVVVQVTPGSQITANKYIAQFCL